MVTTHKNMSTVQVSQTFEAEIPEQLLPEIHLHYVTEFERVFCLFEVQECWSLIYSSNLSKSTYSVYTYT